MNTMNRCLHLPLVRSLMMLAIVLLGTSISCPSPVGAQTIRQFPAAAKRGTLVVTSPPAVLINGMAARLSPGARIKDVNNMMVMSAALVGQSVLVNYVRDTQGLIHEVWILNAAEARKNLADKPKTDD